MESDLKTSGAGVDFFKEYQKTDFKSQELLGELDKVIEEIRKISLGATVDPEKMRIVLSVFGIANDFVQNHQPVCFKQRDMFAAGLVAGILLKINQKDLK